MGRCGVCKHVIGNSGRSHDLRRSHAACARGYQYTSINCDTCLQLYHTAASGEPAEAKIAFALLEDWVQGFSRNSRNRPPNSDIFYFKAERLDYETLKANVRKGICTQIILSSSPLKNQELEILSDSPLSVQMEVFNASPSSSDSPQLTRSWLLQQKSPSASI